MMQEFGEEGGGEKNGMDKVEETVEDTPKQK